MSRRDYERSENPVGLRDDRTWFDVRGPMRRFSQGPGLDADSFDEDVVWQLNRLRAIGIQRVVVVDLTKPEFGIPVVRVIIPGLELAVVGPGTFALGRRARTFLERRS
jgi:ribosomal protein S12 methylthiotransferase accessory factor